MSNLCRLRTLCLSVGVLACFGLLAALRAEEKSRRELQPQDWESTTARLVLANELMRIHWTGWVTDDEHAEVVRNTVRGINDGFKNKWKVEWLLPEVVSINRKRDNFETSAVEAIRAGEPELRRTVSEEVQFLLPVRASTACLKCHTALRSPRMPLEEGDLLGIASVQLKR